MKKILMIAPFFFGYEIRIKEVLEKKGYEVILYSDFNTRKINLIKKKFENRKKQENINKYYTMLFEKEKEKQFEYIFIIKGIDIPREVLMGFKSIVKNENLYSYQWDDIENGCEDFLNIRDCFKKIYTYSYNDAKKYNFIYRPFFFSKELNNKKLMDITFIGSYSKEREVFLDEFFRRFKKLNLNMKFYLILPKRKILKFMFNIFNRSIAYRLNGFSYDETMDIFSKSKSILELQSPRQNSITTRSIEALAIKSKVISSTEDIFNKDFYSKENYYLWNNKIFFELQEWLKIPYQELDKDILIKYKIDSWIDEIFTE